MILTSLRNKHEIDTHDLKNIKILSQLNNIYSDIPETKCLNCPGKKAVEADCCKTFCPPMFYSEFVSIMRDLEKKDFFNIDHKEKYNKMLWDCIDLYLNPTYTIHCLHENNGCCNIYEHRPFSCRMFGLYSKKEYSDRLEFIHKEIGVEKDQIPFHKQCKNIKITSKKKSLTELESNELYRKLMRVDMELLGNDVSILSGSTYNTFYAHFLCAFLDDSVLKTFTFLKKNLMQNYDDFMTNKITKEEFEKYKSETDEILILVKEQTK